MEAEFANTWTREACHETFTVNRKKVEPFDVFRHRVHTPKYNHRREVYGLLPIRPSDKANVHLTDVGNTSAAQVAWKCVYCSMGIEHGSWENTISAGRSLLSYIAKIRSNGQTSPRATRW